MVALPHETPVIPTSALVLAVNLLLPLFAPLLHDDDDPETLILRSLTDYRPGTTQELSLVTEIIGCHLKQQSLLACSARSGTPRAYADRAVVQAGQLSRAWQQAQRRLDALQKDRHARAQAQAQAVSGADAPDQAQGDEPPARGTAARDTTAPTSDPGAIAVNASGAAVAPADPCATGTANAGIPIAPQVAAAAAQRPAIPPSDAAAPPPDTADNNLADVAAAERALCKAERLLALMQEHVKGGVAPQSKAAQDIRNQQRIVAVARMALQQAQRRAGQPAGSGADPDRAVA